MHGTRQVHGVPAQPLRTHEGGGSPQYVEVGVGAAKLLVLEYVHCTNIITLIAIASADLLMTRKQWPTC